MAAITRRRRWLEETRPRDRRELVIVNGKVMTCDQFKVGAEIRMARCDALPAELRALCDEFNLHAGDVADLAAQGKSAADIRKMAERKIGPGI
jgi:hypothetical protein